MTNKEILAKVKGMPVMIIGDVMIDAYLFGNVNRISPEAPVPIVNVSSSDNRLGGAANVALNIQALHARPILCSVVGNDTKADDFFQLMELEKMTTAGILRSEKRLTTTKLRVLGNQVQLLRIDEETTDMLDREDEKRFIEVIIGLIEKEKPAAILFQDYDKGCITPEVIKRVVSEANRLHIPTTVDPKKRNFSSYKKVTLFKPNLKELKEGLGVDSNQLSEEFLNGSAEQLHQSQDIEMILITLSEQGAYISDRRIPDNPDSFKVPAHIRTIADVSGAGDTVISVATICLALGMNTKEIIEYSNLAGGIVCESVGVVPIDRKRFYGEVIGSLQ